MSASYVQKWYQRVFTRVVDLVGDYAGKELFLVEGDSLLLKCFEDKRLDFDDGFQLLHAVYIVEAELEKLVRRKCNFQVVFFKAHSSLCVPPSAAITSRSKYLLARSVIIKHLSLRLQNSHPGLKIRCFNSYRDVAFREYLQSAGVYFIMCHDGTRSISTSEELQDGPIIAKNSLAFRTMIYWLMLFGFNVALINEVEWRDSKVFARVIEGDRHQEEDHESESTESDDIEPGSGTDDYNSLSVEDFDSIETLIQSEADSFSEREYLAVLTLSQLLTLDPSLASLAASFLLHLSCLSNLSLAQRIVQKVNFGDPDYESALSNFTNEFSKISRAAIDHERWTNLMHGNGIHSNLEDLIDGRLMRAVLKTAGKEASNYIQVTRVSEDYRRLCKALSSLVAIADPLKMVASPKGNLQVLRGFGSSKKDHATILPFSNPVFDKHLESIHVVVDDSPLAAASMALPVLSREISHWHNAKKSLDSKKAAAIDSAKRVTKWKNPTRSNQVYMREMTSYAASLTNTNGKALTPEVIFLSTTKPPINKPNDRSAKKDLASKEQKAAKGTGSKKEAVNGGLSKADLIIAENKAKKDKTEISRTLAAWDTIRQRLDRLGPEARYIETGAYLHRLEPAKAGILRLEIEMYCLQALLLQWANFCKEDRKEDGYGIAALIWDLTRKFGSNRSDLTKVAAVHIKKVCSMMGLTSPGFTSVLPDQPLTFTFIYPIAKIGALSVDLPPREFQLLHCGPYMDRHTDSRPDARVPSFEPDGWQRKVLDELDQNNSIFVVAPTSAGKTFISFYAMEKVLREGNDGILVYVAPTKALVNQIAAEILGRFSKNYPHAGSTVWAIHTRDYRINNPSGCQILVTVPHILQIMLLAPSNARSWAPRVKSIVFDEIHSIGQADDGVVWEQLLLLAPCQIIALSATVGNPTEFNNWLESTQKSFGMQITMIEHSQRYSDLRKSIYAPPAELSFKGLKDIGPSIGSLGLDRTLDLTFFHPVASLVNKSRGIPDDLTLEARDCLLLWKSMVKHATEEFLVPKALHPDHALPPFIKKIDIFAWEAELKKLLANWMANSVSPFDEVIKELSGSLHTMEAVQANGVNSSANKKSDPVRGDGTMVVESSNALSSSVKGSEVIVPGDLRSTTLPLLVRLHERNALPAILFNYDRQTCEAIAHAVLSRLEKAEKRYKDTSQEWKKLVNGFEDWRKAEEIKHTRKVPKAAEKKKKAKGNDDDDEPPVSKFDALRDSASEEKNFYESFNPDEPLPRYSFANNKKYETASLKEDLRLLERKGQPEWIRECLKRGIGVHHAGMNRKYRTIVEILFRKGYLRVVVATGTLALGINMPCTTVVFSGDSIFLTALNFRQAAGRAGRRGFDLLGNVVFQGVPIGKVCRLLSSRLPDLNGHFPITTTLVLRLFTLLHESNASSYAVQAINSLLSQPRLYLGGEAFRHQVLHHLRFSIEYLRKQGLLGFSGEPINYSSCVSHLYFTENSSFAFHALLRGGYFQKLCMDTKQPEDERLRILMVVLANLFGRRTCRNVQREFIENIVKKSPSVVFLPPMPRKAAAMLQGHNRVTLATYSTYVQTFAKQHLHDDERHLPLTGVEVGGKESPETSKILGALPSTKSRSAFVALSGHGDEFESISDLCSTVRSGVFLEEAVVPHLQNHPDETSSPLNAYLYDFFRHGSLDPLEKANGIRKSDVWFLLNDFSLVLATIVTSLANYLHLKNEQDGDMTDVVGGGDAQEIDADQKLAEELINPMPQVGQAKVEPSGPKPKAKVVESWDEEEFEEDDGDDEDDGDYSDDDYADQKDGSSEEMKLYKVYCTFCKLQTSFDEKFRAIGA